MSADSPMAPDSAVSESEEEGTKTIGQSILDYPTHWGRTYHRFKAGSYRYPNDEQELERYDLIHAIVTRIHQGHLFFAPAHGARRVLDIGTGTGIWPIELADSGLCAGAKITGIDLSPTQPSAVPANVRFEIQDCNDREWHRDLGSIDYIHVRMMLGSLPEPLGLIKNAKRYLRPGTGWFEWHDIYPVSYSDDNSIPPNWAVSVWENQLNRASNKLGAPIRVADKIKRWMEEAGYVDIHEHINKLPIGKWPKDKELKLIGKNWQVANDSGLSAISYKLLSEGLGFTRSEIEVQLAGVRKSFGRRDVHSYHKLYVVYGRRPSAEEEQKRRSRTSRVR